MAWGGPCWDLHLVLSYDCVNNDDHLEMAASSTILDGYPLIKHLISFNETHIQDVDDVGAIGVKKKKYSFRKRKQNVVEGSIF